MTTGSVALASLGEGEGLTFASVCMAMDRYLRKTGMWKYRCTFGHGGFD